jgi:hypothetical protein
MVCTYYGRPIQQCSIVSVFLNYNCCFDPMSCSSRTCQLYEIQQALYGVGLTSTVGGFLSCDQIQAEIDAGRPIIAAYMGSFSGHVVVIYGYKKVQSQFAGLVDVGDLVSQIYVYDPYYGPFRPNYASAFNYAGQLARTDSIFAIRPISLAVKGPSWKIESDEYLSDDHFKSTVRDCNFLKMSFPAVNMHRLGSSSAICILVNLGGIPN